ncbi:MAG: hypothetical protein Q9170_005349 [Blastenia crenularia]
MSTATPTSILLPADFIALLSKATRCSDYKTSQTLYDLDSAMAILNMLRNAYHSALIVHGIKNEMESNPARNPPLSLEACFDEVMLDEMTHRLLAAKSALAEAEEEGKGQVEQGKRIEADTGGLDGLQ